MSWALVGSAAVTVVGGYLTQQDAQENAEEARKAMNPYGQYRDEAAKSLNALMENPERIQEMPGYNARLQAASRTMAAQGYTGSGNALIAAANAGGAAYQQAFGNLAMLSGAGQAPGRGSMTAAKMQNSAQSDYLDSAVYAGSRAWDALAGMGGGGNTFTSPDISITPGSLQTVDTSYHPSLPPIQGV